MVLKRTVECLRLLCGNESLTTESVEGSALTLESIDNIHSSDSLPLGMLSVGDSITDDVLKENLKDTSGLLIDQARDTLDTTSASKTADGRLGDTLDVITQNFAVTLGASLAETFASFASSSHVDYFLSVQIRMMLIPGFSAFIYCPQQLTVRYSLSCDLHLSLGAKCWILSFNYLAQKNDLFFSSNSIGKMWISIFCASYIYDCFNLH